MSQPDTYASAFASLIGAQHAFPFWKGRVALYAILRALGVGEGDEVIVPGYTCVMNVNPIYYVGARPIYVDIRSHDYNMDPRAVRDAISPRTRAVIAQHTYGFPVDFAAINAATSQHDIPIIEDCCLALGSTYHGKKVGTLGRAAYFSSQWNKPYTTGLGGIAVTSDNTLAGKLSNLVRSELLPPPPQAVAALRMQHLIYRAVIYPRTTALAASLFRRLTDLGLVVGSSDNEEYAPMAPEGFFRGMSEFQMRVGLRRIRTIHAAMQHRRRIAQIYDARLTRAGWPPLAFDPGADPVLVRYPVRVSDKQRALTKAATRGVEIGSWFESPLHPARTSLEAYGYKQGQCPVAERACGQVINLPLHPRVSERTAERTAHFVAEIGPPQF